MTEEQESKEQEAEREAREEADAAQPMNPQGLEDHPDTNADPDTPLTADEALAEEGEPEHPDADPNQPDNQKVEQDDDEDDSE